MDIIEIQLKNEIGTNITLKREKLFMFDEEQRILKVTDGQETIFISPLENVLFARKGSEIK